MKPLRCPIFLLLLLAAGCTATANVRPTHQLQWVPAPPPTTQPTAEPAK